MTVLIVDDEANLRRMLREFIESFAHTIEVEVEILEAANFPEAFDQVRRADVVLCDGHFPMNADPKFSQTPWIYVHGLCRSGIMLGTQRFALMTGDPDCAEAAKTLYHISVFQKPFDAAEVMNWIFSGVAQKVAA
jgi:CheY-like chemotaxis protein